MAILACCESLYALGRMADNSFDACVTDPPYALRMNCIAWDYELPSIELWREVLRVLKPGAHLVSFSSARTYHRAASGIEDAGFEIRDQLMWLNGQGFPKQPTQLKPAHEPICLARKPFKTSEVQNVCDWGTGSLNPESCRVGDRQNARQVSGKKSQKHVYGPIHVDGGKVYDKGRWPSNVLHDGVLENRPYESFFYCAKASPSERGDSTHPTQKPLALMRYLVRLVTPTGGSVLDPFVGSGTTVVACELEGFHSVGIDREAEYIEIAKRRLTALEEAA